MLRVSSAATLRATAHSFLARTRRMQELDRLADEAQLHPERADEWPLPIYVAQGILEAARAAEFIDPEPER